MFKKLPDGNTIWVKHDQEDDLLRLEEEETPLTLETSVLKQMTNLSKKTLEGSVNLTSSNKNLIKSINKVAKKGCKPVDIVIPVYGNLHVVKPCIESILSRTSYPYKLIIVDDFSPENKTKSWLKKFAKDHPEHNVIFHAKNKGFATACNMGIKAGDGEYICILNSDVLVTPNWLSKLVLALEADEKNVIVNPVTNNTALIDVPLHPGCSYLDMNRGLEALSVHNQHEIMPTGFCFMLKRQTIKEVGYFDEAYVSYAEESDYWMRCLSYVSPSGEFKRYRAVLADDTYLFHERGSSFASVGLRKHNATRKAGSERFHKLWPAFKDWRKHNKLEENIQYLKDQLPKRVIEKESPYNIAFLVFSSAYCGGMAFITDIVNELQERGINAKVVQIKRSPELTPPPTMAELRVGVIHYDTPEELIENFSEEVFDSGLIVSATAELSPLADAVSEKNSKIDHLLFAQSYDPALAPNDEVKKRIMSVYSTVPNIISNAKWLDEAIKSVSKRSTLGYINPGVNRDLFFPRGRDKGDDRLTVAFVLTSAGDEYRGFDRGSEAAFHLAKLANAAGVDLRIMGIGVDQVQGAPFITCTGYMRQSNMAAFLGTEVDVLCDPCHLHTYGMPSIEAMASGCVPITWDNCGINEFATSGENSVILPREATPEELAKKIFSIITDKNKLSELKNNAVKVPHKRQESVSRFINLIEKKLHLRAEKRKINVITPHLRKHGGPSTILYTAELLSKLGHDVTLTTIYSDISPELLKEITVPLSTNWENPSPCDMVIVNSDNPYTDHFSFLESAKKKVLLKLSHNPRFQQLEDKALKVDWDKIVTSTDWLVDACKNPRTDEGWTHPPREAETVGWYHYGHKNFDKKYTDRVYFRGGALNICTLIHHHPLKGTQQAITTLEKFKEVYGNEVNIFGFGEVKNFHPPKWMRYYVNLDRKQMAELFSQIDIMLLASKTEGLGRLALEAMSSSCLVVKTPTGAPFAKDMDNCIVTHGFEPEDLLEGLERLGKDREKFESIIKNGYETAKRYADPTEYTNNWANIIEELFENHE